jgi:phytoene dehydrogenase-like protein
VGGELLASIGMPALPGEALPGYVAWLPDRVVTLHREPHLWANERAKILGDTPAHRLFWQWMDRLAAAFWQASRAGVRMPMASWSDAVHNLRQLGWGQMGLLRYLRWTMGDALRSCGLRDDAPLVGLLSMLLEDTVHARIDDAPLINAALGMTIRGAGLTRAQGGMFGFWKRFAAHYGSIGGVLKIGCPAQWIEPRNDGYLVVTRKGTFDADQIVSAIPAPLTARIAPPRVRAKLLPYLQRDAKHLGGALVVFLGVPENEVADQSFTHHQLLHDYRQPLGNGNNLFISVSAPGDLESAPAGHRAVMISTHCELDEWEKLDEVGYECRKEAMGLRLVELARRVYPRLGERCVVREIATPRTFERFTRRPRGAVGGVRQSQANTNQRSLPHDIGVPGFWLDGDSTWPGLGTVACVLGSRIVADKVVARALKQSPAASPGSMKAMRHAGMIAKQSSLSDA